MPLNADDIEIVQAIKQETEETGGGPGSTDIPFPEPINPLEDGLESAALFLVESGRRNKAVSIWSYQGKLRFRDIENSGTGYTLSQILAGAGGITPDSHKKLRQLIHFINDGPAEGFISGAYKETLPSGPFPTSEIWWESSSKLKKIVELLTTWNGINITQEKWKIYDTDGTTVLWTITDTINHTGVFETDRTRTITAGDA